MTVPEYQAAQAAARQKRPKPKKGKAVVVPSGGSWNDEIKKRLSRGLGRYDG